MSSSLVGYLADWVFDRLTAARGRGWFSRGGSLFLRLDRGGKREIVTQPGSQSMFDTCSEEKSLTTVGLEPSDPIT